ncbi:creatininase family protein [Pseudoroseicyclus tamaricis]|uniref:Creatininase family protein n=1 Tax=Pseudoroseicyclus tamaricis TaxID=2705421 RepID=A0A6B2JGY9_9RHOB|nr:creatininase family protein [Pseudoroseicyclus tamaricis]NDV00501.1 creatininase family protein [Pseudoroseicyclus tamaricis]
MTGSSTPTSDTTTTSTSAPDHRMVPYFDEMTSIEVGKAIEDNAVILISLGATEQHGGHLPLGADTMQGIELARRTVAKLHAEGHPAIVGPAIPFGPRGFLSETPIKLPGNVNFSAQTFMLVLEEIGREIIEQGFRRLYFLGFHAESDAPMQIVAKKLCETTEANVVTLNWLVGARPRYSKYMEAKAQDGHGGEGETCRMLATAPHLCRMHLAEPWHPTPRDDRPDADNLPYLGGGVGRYKMAEPYFEGFKSGITGDPQLATAERGELVYDLMTGWLVDVIRHDLSGTEDYSRAEL